MAFGCGERHRLTGDLARWRKLARMDATHIDLFDLAEQRLAWADQRQAVLAQNVANANTPGYKPHDLRPFADMLAGTRWCDPVRTQPNHLAGTLAPARQAKSSIARTRMHPMATA